MIEQVDYSQEEIRILRHMTREWWSGWWKGWDREFAPGSLRFCSFIAFAQGYGELEEAWAEALWNKHRQRALDMLADNQAYLKTDDPFLSKVGKVGAKEGRTTAMAMNFALLYGGGVGRLHG